mgnify:CR=1 FL=1
MFKKLSYSIILLLFFSHLLPAREKAPEDTAVIKYTDEVFQDQNIGVTVSGSGKEVHFIRCQFLRLVEHGVWIDPGNTCYFDDCIFDDINGAATSRGIVNNGSNVVIDTGCSFNNIGGEAVATWSNGKTDINGATFTDITQTTLNYYQGSGSIMNSAFTRCPVSIQFVQATPASQVKIAGNNFRPDISNPGHSIIIHDQTTNAEISQNSIEKADTAILVTENSSALIQENSIVNTQLGPSINVTNSTARITGNYIQFTNLNDLVFFHDASGEVSDNYLLDGSDNGIYLWDSSVTATGNFIAGNKILGIGADSENGVGTGSSLTARHNTILNNNNGAIGVDKHGSVHAEFNIAGNTVTAASPSIYTYYNDGNNTFVGTALTGRSKAITFRDNACYQGKTKNIMLFEMDQSPKAGPIKLENLIVTRAREEGLYGDNLESNLEVNNCSFYGNLISPGASNSQVLINRNSSPVFRNCTFLQGTGSAYLRCIENSADARYCYWGNAGGPVNPSSTLENVVYSPFNTDPFIRGTIEEGFSGAAGNVLTAAFPNPYQFRIEASLSEDVQNGLIGKAWFLNSPQATSPPGAVRYLDIWIDSRIWMKSNKISIYIRFTDAEIPSDKYPGIFQYNAASGVWEETFTRETVKEGAFRVVRLDYSPLSGDKITGTLALVQRDAPPAAGTGWMFR